MASGARVSRVGPDPCYVPTMIRDRPLASASDPVLIRFRRALDAEFGGRIERVVPFGSTGDAVDNAGRVR
jgi:hypothetical protein